MYLRIPLSRLQFAEGTGTSNLLSYQPLNDNNQTSVILQDDSVLNEHRNIARTIWNTCQILMQIISSRSDSHTEGESFRQFKGGSGSVVSDSWMEVSLLMPCLIPPAFEKQKLVRPVHRMQLLARKEILEPPKFDDRRYETSDLPELRSRKRLEAQIVWSLQATNADLRYISRH